MKNTVYTLLAAGIVSVGAILHSGCTTMKGACECGCGVCTCAQACNCVEGRWALDVKCGWFKVVKKAGAYEGSFLWMGGSPVAFLDVKVDGNRVTARRAEGKNRFRVIEGCVQDGVFVGSVYVIDAFGKKSGAKDVKGTRIAPLPAAPNLEALKFGEAVNLLAEGMAGWEALDKNYFGWSFKDGVLSNRILRDAQGKRKGASANLKTKRADFEDFKLSYDVRVLKDCNSGVYLRGIYELQVLDSYGKPVDCHNMAAPYGRITPTVAAEKPAGEWQHVDAILCDRHVTVTLNGVKIVDNQPLEGVTGGSLTTNEFVPGPLYLQGDHSDADFKNMVLTPIVK